MKSYVARWMEEAPEVIGCSSAPPRGAALIDGNIPGASEILVPEHAGVANAVGSASASARTTVA